MNQSREETRETVLGRLDMLEMRLDKLEGFPETKKIMDLDSFLKNDYAEYVRQQNELAVFKSRKMPQSQSALDLDRLNDQNKQLRIQLKMLKIKNSQAEGNSYIPQIPLPQNQAVRIQQLQAESHDLTTKLTHLRRKNKAYTTATKAGDMFGQYENIIRQLESHRKLSFELGEEFKYYIKEINARTGKNQNANTLLINMK